MRAYWLESRKEVYPFRPQRGLPFAAAKRLALCVGEEVCPLFRGRELPCFALRAIARLRSLRKKGVKRVWFDVVVR